MQALEQQQGRLDAAANSIVQVSPTGLTVRLDRGFVFRECKLRTHVPVQMGIGHVVNHLTDSPAFRAVRSI